MPGWKMFQFHLAILEGYHYIMEAFSEESKRIPKGPLRSRVKLARRQRLL